MKPSFISSSKPCVSMNQTSFFARLEAMREVYILSAVRTPIGKFGGSLASQTAVDLGVVAAKAAMKRAGVQPTQVEETIFGNARQAGGGPNPARQISIRNGVPKESPAYTVNKACGSGMKSGRQAPAIVGKPLFFCYCNSIDENHVRLAAASGSFAPRHSSTVV